MKISKLEPGSILLNHNVSSRARATLSWSILMIFGFSRKSHFYFWVFLAKKSKKIDVAHETGWMKKLSVVRFDDLKDTWRRSGAPLMKPERINKQFHQFRNWLIYLIHEKWKIYTKWHFFINFSRFFRN